MFSHHILAQEPSEAREAFEKRLDAWKERHMNSTPIGAGVGADGRVTVIYTYWIADKPVAEPPLGDGGQKDPKIN